MKTPEPNPEKSLVSSPRVGERTLVASDLGYVRERLSEELGAMAGGRLLITGGAGFLGFYLVQTVVDFNRRQEAQKRIELTVLDHLGRGVPGWLESCESSGELRLLRHDITNPLPSAVVDEPWDWILHAASIASPIFYRKYPIQTMDANVLGLRRLLDLCVRQSEDGRSPRGFLFFSTSEIYGDPAADCIPTKETYWGHVSSLGPRACYDESKRFGETLCVNFQQQHGVPIQIVRPFNNYGPGLKASDGRLLSDFAQCVVEGRDIVMYSDGRPTRTFCYVADAIVGYFKVLVKGRPGEAYNIGSDRPELSVAEVANRVVAAASELFGYSGRVVRRVHADDDYLTDNPNRRCPDIGKARRELAFEPSVDFDDGIRRMLTWYQDEPNEALA